MNTHNRDVLTNDLEIITLGCRLNAYESEVIRGVVPPLHKKRIVINTCSVTQSAIRQSNRKIKQMRKLHPGAEICVTGCAVQLRPDFYEQMGEVDRVIGNTEKMLANSYEGDFVTDKKLVGDIMQVSSNTNNNTLVSFKDKARAFVEIQNGCDHRCTFCSIPFSRGNNRSTAPKKIVEQIAMLCGVGYNEVTLTGVDITNYGTDIGHSFSMLINDILCAVPELPRLRLSSVDVAEVDNQFIKLFATNERLMPHLHLSLQSGDNMILKRMRRRHNREQVYAFCDTVRSVRPDVVFGADIIAGFPTETEDMFNNSYALLRELNFSFVHVFPFSSNEQTPAAKMPQVDRATIKHRAKILRGLAAIQSSKLYEHMEGQRHNVLIETTTSGKTGQYANVKFARPIDAKLIGDIIEVSVGKGGMVC